LKALKEAKGALTSLRTKTLLPNKALDTSNIPPPDFGLIAVDPIMKSILERRWKECQQCIAANAPLAATVMMGGLLEALFVARANLMANKGPLFRAKKAPLDAKSKKPIPLSNWTLRSYIDVAAELGWISSSGKDVAAVLRDYRNYIHPEKERSHGVNLSAHDSAMFWEITRGLTGQLLHSTTAATGTT
jgi:hypothetical protein